MEMLDKIERYIFNRMSESEKADFEIDMHNNPVLKEQVKLENAIVEQIRSRAFIDEQINMAKNELMQEKFEKYCLNRMTESERTDFEIELKQKPELKELLDLENAIVPQIRARALVNDQIIKAKKELNKTKLIRMVMIPLAAAACFLLVFFLNGILEQSKFDKLYTSNYISYPNDYIENRSGGIEIENQNEAEVDSTTAMAAYDNKQFAIAEEQITKILSQRKTPELQFYLAITQLEIGKTKSAINTLKKLLSQPKDYRYYDQTRWHLALAHIKMRKKSEAIKYLEELKDSKDWEKAEKLLKNLKLL